MYFIVYNDAVEHSGVKGMEWYKRRYQNQDGSLTPLGRVHYGVGPPRGSKGPNASSGAKRTRKTEGSGGTSFGNSRKNQKYGSSESVTTGTDEYGNRDNYGENQLPDRQPSFSDKPKQMTPKEKELQDIIDHGSAKEILKRASEFSEDQLKQAAGRLNAQKAIRDIQSAEGREKAENFIKSYSNLQKFTNVTSKMMNDVKDVVSYADRINKLFGGKGLAGAKEVTNAASKVADNANIVANKVGDIIRTGDLAQAKANRNDMSNDDIDKVIARAEKFKTLDKAISSAETDNKKPKQESSNQSNNDDDSDLYDRLYQSRKDKGAQPEDSDLFEKVYQRREDQSASSKPQKAASPTQNTSKTTASQPSESPKQTKTMDADAMLGKANEVMSKSSESPNERIKKANEGLANAAKANQAAAEKVSKVVDGYGEKQVSNNKSLLEKASNFIKSVNSGSSPYGHYDAKTGEWVHNDDMPRRAPGDFSAVDRAQELRKKSRRW